MLAAFTLVASVGRGGGLTDGCNSISAGDLDQALSDLRKAALVLNELPTTNLYQEFQVIGEAGAAKALEFLVLDSKTGAFPPQDCKTAAEAVLASQQGQSELATGKLKSLLRQHPSNPIVVFLASLHSLKMFKYEWYAEADGDKELRELFLGIADQERRSLAAFFCINNAVYQLARAEHLSDEKPERPYASSPRTGALNNAYNDFHAAIAYAQTDRVKAACHLGALTAGKPVLQRISRRGVLYGFGGKLIEGEEFRDMLAGHRGSLESMQVKVPGGLTVPFSAKMRLIIIGTLAFLAYAFWPRHRRSQ